MTTFLKPDDLKRSSINESRQPHRLTYGGFGFSVGWTGQINRRVHHRFDVRCIVSESRRNYEKRINPTKEDFPSYLTLEVRDLASLCRLNSLLNMCKSPHLLRSHVGFPDTDGREVIPIVCSTNRKRRERFRASQISNTSFTSIDKCLPSLNQRIVGLGIPLTKQGRV